MELVTSTFEKVLEESQDNQSSRSVARIRGNTSCVPLLGYGNTDDVPLFPEKRKRKDKTQMRDEKNTKKDGRKGRMRGDTADIIFGGSDSGCIGAWRLD
jgi:hypothetical protein